MRVVARLPVRERGDLDDLARGRRRCGEQPHRPRVVADAVVDDEPGRRDRARGRGTGLELVRILVHIGEDAAHGHAVAADLPRDITIDVFGSDNLDRRGARDRQAEQDRREQSAGNAAQRRRVTRPPNRPAARAARVADECIRRHPLLAPVAAKPQRLEVNHRRARGAPLPQSEQRP